MGVASETSGDSMIGAANFLERLEAEAVPIVDVREKLPDKKISISVDLSSADTAEPSRDHSSAEFATTSVSEDETRPLSASLARHRALLEQVPRCLVLERLIEMWRIGRIPMGLFCVSGPRIVRV